MTAKSIAFACLSLTAATGLVAILVADEVRNMATHGRWLQHDISRPRPPVVEPVGSPAAGPAPAPGTPSFCSMEPTSTPGRPPTEGRRGGR